MILQPLRALYPRLRPSGLHGSSLAGCLDQGGTARVLFKFQRLGFQLAAECSCARLSSCCKLNRVPRLCSLFTRLTHPKIIRKCGRPSPRTASHFRVGRHLLGFPSPSLPTQLGPFFLDPRSRPTPFLLAPRGLSRQPSTAHCPQVPLRRPPIPAHQGPTRSLYILCRFTDQTLPDPPFRFCDPGRYVSLTPLVPHPYNQPRHYSSLHRPSLYSSRKPFTLPQDVYPPNPALPDLFLRTSIDNTKKNLFEDAFCPRLHYSCHRRRHLRVRHQLPGHGRCRWATRLQPNQLNCPTQ